VILKFFLQPFQLRPDADPQKRIEVAQRLIEEKDLWLLHQSPRNGDTLLLSTTQLPRVSFKQSFYLEHARHLVDPLLDRSLVDFLQRQGESYVLEHLHVRIERPVLKDQAHVSVLRR